MDPGGEIMSVSFVVPTLNEEGNIKRVYTLIDEVLNNTSIEWELIFVDDKSTDNTQFEINELNGEKVRLIISPERRGLGSALSLGWRQAANDFVLFLDCDTGISTDDLLSLISKRNSKTVVIGSRYIRGSNIHGAPKFKVFLSKTLNSLAGFLTQINVADLSHSLRIFPNHFVDATEIPTHPGYFWMQGVLFKRNSYDFEEVPITFRERHVGLTKNATVKMIFSVLNVLPKLVLERFK